MKKPHIIVLALVLLFVSAPLTAQTYKALCVGNNDYLTPGYDRLYAENDADDISDALVNELGWNSSDVVPRTGIHATKHYIQTPLTDWSDSTAWTILFSFSGHAIPTGVYKGLVTKDEEYLKADHFLGYLESGSPNYEKFAFIIDAPYSGFLADDMDRGVIMTACTTSETAEEDEVSEHGFFSYYVLEGLDDMHADSDNDNVITAEEIFDYAEYEVEEDENTTQTPQFADSDPGNDLNLTIIQAPTNLYITGEWDQEEPDHPTLHWSPSIGSTKYMIYRLMNGSSTWHLIDSTTSSQYEDTEAVVVEPGENKLDFYHVRGKNAYALSDSSNIASEWVDLLKTSGLNDEIIVDKLILDQNYPNPFNPETTIGFRLKEARHVTLKVYDITGKVVAELVNENRSAGYHSVTWNASNVASGVYLYRITAGRYTDIKRMVVVK
jgi:hypothetical protein